MVFVSFFVILIVPSTKLGAPSSVSPPSQGCALKSAVTSHRRLSKEQKKYLINLLLIGERTGRKSSPDEVSMSMRKLEVPMAFVYYQLKTTSSPNRSQVFSPG